jgi:hypothetical protein
MAKAAQSAFVGHSALNVPRHASAGFTLTLLRQAMHVGLGSFVMSAQKSGSAPFMPHSVWHFDVAGHAQFLTNRLLYAA